MAQSTVINWKQYPFARLFFPFVIGILLQEFLKPIEGKVLVAGLAVLLLWMWIRGLKRSLHPHQNPFSWLLMLFLLLLGHLNGSLSDERKSSWHFCRQLEDSTQYFLAEIQKIAPGSKSLKITGQVRAVRVKEQWKATKGKLLLYIMPGGEDLGQLKVGEQIMFEARADAPPKPQNPYQFDYAAYLGGQEIYHQAFVRNYVLLPGKSHRWLATWRQAQLRLIQTYLPNPDHHAILEAMLFGEKTHLEADTRQLYAEVGALHVLAVSGLHVGIIFMVLQFVLGKLVLLERRPFLLQICLMASLWCYAFLAGASPSVVRATTMFSFFILGKLLFKNGNAYNTLAASAFFLLLVEPAWLKQPGFQLSYLAVFGILFFQGRIYRCWIPDQQLLDGIWKLTTVSIAAQITTLPISLYYFQQLPTFFWLSGLLVVPIAPVLLVAGGLLLAFDLVFPVMASWLAIGLGYVLDCLHFLLRGIQMLPYSLVQISDFQWWEALGAYGALILFMLLILQPTARWATPILLILTALQIGKMVVSYQKSQQPEIVFYSTKDSWLVDFRLGKELFTYTEKPLDERALSFTAGPFRQRRNVQNIVTDSSNTMVYFTDEFFRFFEISVIKAREQGVWEHPAGGSTILLLEEGLSKETVEALLASYQPTALLLHPGMRFFWKEKLSHWVEEVPTQVHHLKYDGAYWIRSARKPVQLPPLRENSPGSG